MRLLLINNLTQYLEPLEKILKHHELDIIDFNQISLTDINKYDAIILSGSYEFTPYDEGFLKEIQIIKEYNKPILGICFGFQLICHAYDGKLEKLTIPEKGTLDLEIIKSDEIFNNINSLKVFENHEWHIKEINYLIPLAKSKDSIEIVKHPKKPIYGFQFHPEMFLGETNGINLVNNFLKLCKNKSKPL